MSRNPIASIATRVRYMGSSRYCALCKRTASRFLPAGTRNSRSDAMCPFCGSLERDRLTLAFLRSRTNLFDGGARNLLHIAPERSLEKIFAEAAGDGYLSADLMAEGVMETMDITTIQHDDESFDVIYCSHVLEHVADDQKAMRELFRVLRTDGFAILNVPVGAGKTIEDPSITDPAERERLFGQRDHVRQYGEDYEDRLIKAGFEVSTYSPASFLDPSEIKRQGMSNAATGVVYYCAK